MNCIESSLSHIVVSAYRFQWKIDKDLCLEKGTPAKSDPFYAGADKESIWQMTFYPKGSSRSATDYASIYLKMSNGSPVTASSTLALIISGKVVVQQTLYERIHEENEERFLENFAKEEDICYPLLVLCDLKISERTKTLPYIRRVEDFNQVLTDIHSLLSQQEGTDVEIITRDQMKFNAHKVILAARSAVLSAMFQSNMLENLEGKFTISEMDGSDVAEFLQYVYSGNLTKWSLPLCMNLFVAGDKYQINTLKNTCSLYLQQNISVETSVNILVLADMHGDELLKKAALEFITKHAEEVLQTERWKTMVQEKQHLVNEIVSKMAEYN